MEPKAIRLAVILIYLMPVNMASAGPFCKGNDEYILEFHGEKIASIKLDKNCLDNHIVHRKKGTPYIRVPFYYNEKGVVFSKNETVAQGGKELKEGYFKIEAGKNNNFIGIKISELISSSVVVEERVGEIKISGYKYAPYDYYLVNKKNKSSYISCVKNGFCVRHQLLVNNIFMDIGVREDSVQDFSFLISNVENSIKKLIN